MHRRRHDSKEVVSASLSSSSPPPSPDGSLPITTLPRREYRWRCLCYVRLRKIIIGFSLMNKIIVALSVAFFGWWFIRELLYWIPRIEQPFEKYPYWRAMIFNPIRYVHAKYLDPVRPASVRHFAMTQSTAFVINLDRSSQRMKQFWWVNSAGGVAPMIQRFPAHEWTTSINDTETIRIQEYWQQQYPFLKISARKGNYGDAGCSLSHLLLWKETLLDGNQEYIFVFEDDAQLLNPLRQSSVGNGSYPHIDAPDVADIIFLAHPASKRVNVTWTGSEEPATRLLGGFGTWGYIMTREGAQKMLACLQTSRKPVDLSFFAAAPMRIYLPISSQFPTVLHNQMPSTRLGLNKK